MASLYQDITRIENEMDDKPDKLDEVISLLRRIANDLEDINIKLDRGDD